MWDSILNYIATSKKEPVFSMECCYNTIAYTLTTEVITGRPQLCVKIKIRILHIKYVSLVNISADLFIIEAQDMWLSWWATM